MTEWNQTVEASIRKERGDIEARYGVLIGETDIRCGACGKSWSTFHVCSKMSPERKAKVEALKAQLERPISLKTAEEHREEFGINIGMTKEEALEKFREWKATKKTCERCHEGEGKYKGFCSLNLICGEDVQHGAYHQSINLREEFGRGNRDIKINSLRITPKRVSLGKSGG